MWSSTPSCIPSDWRRGGAEALADAVGYGYQLGPGPRASSPHRDAYVWYAGEDSVKQSLSFETAFKNASDLCALIRAIGVASGKLKGKGFQRNEERLQKLAAEERVLRQLRAENAKMEDEIKTLKKQGAIESRESPTEPAPPSDPRKLQPLHSMTAEEVEEPRPDTAASVRSAMSVRSAASSVRSAASARSTAAAADAPARNTPWLQSA